MADVKVSALPAGIVTAASLVPVVTGGTTQRVTAGSIAALSGGGTLNTTAYVYGNPPYDGGATPVNINSIADAPNAAYPFQTYIDRLEAAMRTGEVLRKGSVAQVYRLTVGDTSAFGGTARFNRSMIQGASYINASGTSLPTQYRTLAPEIQFGDGIAKSNLTVNGNVSITGNLKYGGTITNGALRAIDPDDPNELIPELAYGEQFELPTPTQDGYLRADADDKNWYFAEPVLVSDTEPPAPTNGTGIWIDPTGTAGPDPNAPFTNVNPPVYLDAPITETATSPLGIVNDIYVEPDVVGAVPVVVNGKRYLLPLLEAPASAVTRTPLFTFADDPVTQQLDGSWIGLDDTGLNYYQPETIAAVPILVGGKKYLLPLIAE